MGDYRKNPEKPFEVRVPNKIRKRITMHEKEKTKMLELGFVKLLVHARARLPRVAPPKKRGSMWSRFTSGVAKMFQIKPTGVRE